MQSTYYLALTIFLTFEVLAIWAGSDLASPQVLSVEEGVNVSVACNVSDTTELEVFWMSNGTTGEFYQNGTVLQLPNINRNESGLYTCFSYNLTYESQDNATEEQEVFLDVLYPAEISYFSMQSDMLLVGMNQTVNCTISGNPEPEVTVFSNWTGTVFYSGTENGVVTINYGPARCEDTSVWICTGSNYLNKGVNTTQTFNFTVFHFNPSIPGIPEACYPSIVLPEAPYDLSHSDVTLNSVTLHWTSGYDRGHRQKFRVYQWHRYALSWVWTGDELIDNSTNHGVGDHFQYTVGALTPHTDYYLKIAALNYLGEPVYSKQSAEFSTKEKPYVPPPPSGGITNKTRNIIIGSVIGASVLIGILFGLIKVYTRRVARHSSYKYMAEKY